MPRYFIKQPNENKDYDFEWADWIPATDSLASSVITADAGITLGTKTQGATAVKQWINGGTDGSMYKITCRITTTQGRIAEDQIFIRVLEL